MALSRLLRRISGAEDATVEALYGAVVAQARRPEFYLQGGVPDTLDGRFDLMTLEAFLVFDTLEGRGAEQRALAQQTCDAMFAAFDDAVRSLGVGDMGVPRKMKAMGTAYLGRVEAYRGALEKDEATLRDALFRNLYRGAEPPEGALNYLASYIYKEHARLRSLPDAAFFAGQLS